MRTHVLLYGLVGGVLIAGLKLIEYPLVNIAITALEPLPVGLVFTLVTAGVVSRKRVSSN